MMKRGIPLASLLRQGGRAVMSQIPEVGERDADEQYTERLIPEKEKQPTPVIQAKTKTIREEPDVLTQDKIKQRFRKLNSIGFRKVFTAFDEFKDYLKTGTYLTTTNTPSKKKAFDTSFGRDFYLENGRIYYRTSIFNMEVIPKDKADDVLRKVFDDPALGMGHGIRGFYKIISDKYLNISRKQCEAFLKRQGSYQLTRPLITPKNPTQKYYQANQCWATDLIDMSKYVQYNEPYMYIMSTQDVFTKKCWLRKLETKKATEVVEKTKTFMTATNKPKILKSDNGESTSTEYKAFLKSLDVKLVRN